MPKIIEIEKKIIGTAATETAPAPLKELEEEKINKALEEEKEPLEVKKKPLKEENCQQEPSTQT
jgi:hypothetical protein